jgi:hypothetical protein
MNSLKFFKAVFIVTLFGSISMTYAETIRISNDITVEVRKGGDATIKVKSIPYTDRLEMGIGTHTATENLDVMNISGGIKSSGTVVLPVPKNSKAAATKLDLFSYEMQYTLKEDKSLLVHADVTYLVKTNYFANLAAILPLGAYDKNGHWQDLTKGSTCELNASGGSKKVFDLFSQVMPFKTRLRSFELKKPYITINVEPGKDSQLSLRDIRANSSDHCFLRMGVSSTLVKGTDAIANAGDKDSFEYIIRFQKAGINPSSDKESENKVSEVDSK